MEFPKPLQSIMTTTRNQRNGGKQDSSNPAKKLKRALYLIMMYYIFTSSYCSFAVEKRYEEILEVYLGLFRAVYALALLLRVLVEKAVSDRTRNIRKYNSSASIDNALELMC